MNPVKRVGAAIIGSDFQALGLVRSLHEKEVPIILIDHELGICRFSKYIKRRVKNYSLLSEQDNFASFLIETAKKEDLKDWVLFPNNDELVKLISLNREKLKEWYRVPVPDWDIVKRFYYKQNAYRNAEILSIPTPKIYNNENSEKLIGTDFDFPIVLKPAFKEKYYPITKKKALRINSKSELINEYKKMASIIDCSDIIIQELVEGGPKNLYSYATFFDGDKCVAGMSARRLRQHPMDFGHATTYAESVDIPELKVIAEKLLKGIGYFGIAEVEFMRDEKKGVFKFIEINGRVWGWHTLAKAAGINLPYLLYQHMTQQKVMVTLPIEGKKWMRLITDLPTVFKELIFKRMTLKEYLKTLTGKKEFAVFSSKDPLPFLMEFVLVPYLWIKRGF
jgi:predicted ATP-grasp superfamily ATP-dependent carboligase